MACRWLLLAVCHGLPSELQVRMQLMLEEQVLAYRLTGNKVAVQLGFRDANQSFSVAAGVVEGADGHRRAKADDTFLFGSGTKPVTAAAVFRMLDARNVSWHSPAAPLLDPWLQRANGTSMEVLFGADVAGASVLDLVRMSAGVPDFETSSGIGHDSCDAAVLKGGWRQVFSPYFWMRCAAESSRNEAVCKAGNCTAYSSTSYQLAGLLLVSLLQPNPENGRWDELDMRRLALPDAAAYPSLQFLSSHGSLNETLTVPGQISSKDWPNVPIFDQNPSILGWTCGNMVGNAEDVAAWFYDLLSPSSASPVVSDAARAEMTRFQTLSKGWMAGKLTYGAGLMESSASLHRWQPAKDDWAYVQGHDGLTFGFYSGNGYLPKADAGFSIVVNNDGELRFAFNVRCWLVQIVAEMAGERKPDLGCSGPTLV